ncbi:DUF4381 domain-containing protein [Oceanicoccus sagamiensis]|uniref:DUF4381 domain-containing protein n=1 Tax=Oceanicoccus sagamiensis TaxID=716816 RepID=A0A1X9NH86_9GAMM|nr:DUF4381 domain-containing protein [Oceanicoccus sagamiensis]ARN75762.1 hypothetical protein BST96_17600 [Oceanicoccus sagamiensis]
MSNPFAPNSGWGNYALEGFSEIALPAAIELWPQTPGWWLLLLAVLYGVSRRCYQAIKRYWRNRYRRVAIQQLNAIQQQVLKGDISALPKVPEIMKAVALQAFPRQDIANLFGGEWEDFLDSSYSGPSFASQFPGVLYALSYQSSTKQGLSEQFWQQCQLWISTHRSAYD